MRGLALAVTAAWCLVAGSAFADLEHEAALDGTQYTVIDPIYEGSTGTISFLRLFNGGTAASTFSITIVNTDAGFTLGGTSIQVPAKASPQYAVTAAGGSNSIFTRAGVSAQSGSHYALYLKNADLLSGYQHVTYNSKSTLFENNSVCATPISQQLASTGSLVLTNVHTSALAGGNYPSVVSVHNYGTALAGIKITAIDAATGTTLGSLVEGVAANSTLNLSEAEIEGPIGFHPTSAQLHVNLVVTNNFGPLTATVGQVIHNATLNGDINMGSVCAMNAVAPTTVTQASTAPVAYCGTFSEPTPYGTATGVFVASLSTSGKIKTLAGGGVGDLVVYDVATGQLTGTSFSAASALGGTPYTYRGTISNGTISISQPGPFGGTLSVTGSTTACN